MKQYFAIVEIEGKEIEKEFKVPDLLDAESVITNSVHISNVHTGRGDKLIRIKRSRKPNKKRKK